MNFTVLRYDTIGSTNTEAANQARQGAAEGLCVVAERQTAGRGRHGRTWVSEKGSGLYLSIVLRPRLSMRCLPLITLMAGIAVHDTLREFGIRPDIKWVNDVLVDEKKISGILAETVDTTLGIAVIVGIGVNLTSRNFPDEIAEIATSVEAVLTASGAKFGMPAALALENTLTGFLAYWYEILDAPEGPDAILDGWRQRSTYFSGKQVRVTISDGTITGETCGLEDNGALRVRSGDGSLNIVQAGDVERVRSGPKKS